MQNNNLNRQDVWVVLPGYNESARIADVIRQVKRYCDQVLVVDDGSKDSTPDSAKAAGAQVISHITNLGKGSALRTGCDYALKNGASQIVVMDSDGQHEPSEIPKFLAELENKDVVVGCRRWNSSMPFVMKVGNFGLHKMMKILYGIEVSDTQSGYRAFSASAYKKIRWRSSDYAMESEMLAKIQKHRLKYSTIPIETIYHDNYKGTTVMNGIKIGFNLILWKIFGLR